MSKPLPPPINGTEQRLDVLISEIRGMRADAAARHADYKAEDAKREEAQVAWRAAMEDHQAATVELKEPAKPARKSTRKTKGGT